MKKADVWREVIWECPSCEEHNQLDACSGSVILGWAEKCPKCGEVAELNE